MRLFVEFYSNQYLCTKFSNRNSHNLDKIPFYQLLNVYFYVIFCVPLFC